VNATFIGVHDYDDQLPDYSTEGLQQLAREMDELLDRFEVGRVRDSAADSAERNDLLLAGNYLRQQLWELESDHFQHGNPCVYTSEAIVGVIFHLRRN